MKKKILCFDIDNVICKTQGNNYKNSKPIKKSIALINTFYSHGFFIKIFTARFMGRFGDNSVKARKLGYSFTMDQLKSWNVRYHKLIFGKPSFDLYIDDKSIFFKKNWPSLLKKKLNVK